MAAGNEALDGEEMQGDELQIQPDDSISQVQAAAKLATLASEAAKATGVQGAIVVQKNAESNVSKEANRSLAAEGRLRDEALARLAAQRAEASREIGLIEAGRLIKSAFDGVLRTVVARPQGEENVDAFDLALAFLKNTQSTHAANSWRHFC